MRLSNQLPGPDIAPATSVALPVFQKVDGTLKLAGPARIHHLAPGFIYQQERAGLQQGIHEPVVGADESIPVLLQIKAIEEHQRHPAPALDHPAEVGGLAHVDAGVERKWEQDIA